MLEDPSRFAFVRNLQAIYPVVRAEVARLPESAWITWQAANASGVRVFPLLMAYRPRWIDQRFEARRALCPETWAWLQQQPGMYTAVISSLAPKGRILPHRDLEEPESLRCHLPLSLPAAGTCEFQVGEQRVQWQEGRCLVFHPYHEHHGHNDGERPRVLLIVDVRPGSDVSGAPEVIDVPPAYGK
tara:strand:+ start:6982 stop:7539 length:558 start_codon:yes stop_codon:yes gene_type:complete